MVNTTWCKCVYKEHKGSRIKYHLYALDGDKRNTWLGAYYSKDLREYVQNGVLRIVNLRLDECTQRFSLVNIDDSEYVKPFLKQFHRVFKDIERVTKGDYEIFPVRDFDEANFKSNMGSVANVAAIDICYNISLLKRTPFDDERVGPKLSVGYSIAQGIYIAKFYNSERYTYYTLQQMLEGVKKFLLDECDIR